MFFISEKIERYCASVSHTPSKDCQAIADYTLAHETMSIMLTGPIEGALLGWLARLNGAKKVLELGTFTGYSALAIAENLPADGSVTSIDSNPKHLAAAQRFWSQSAHGHKIQGLRGDALEIIRTLPGPFDLVFIDAQKTQYPLYLERCLEILSSRGVIVLDNMLYSGMVLDNLAVDGNAQAIRKLNEWLFARKDLQVVLLPIRDGITLIQRRHD